MLVVILVGVLDKIVNRCTVKCTKLHVVAPKKYRYGVQRGGEIVCGVRVHMHDCFDTRLRSCAEGVGLR